MTVHPTRRGVLAGAGALVLGVALPVRGRAQSGAASVIRGDGSAAPLRAQRLHPRRRRRHRDRARQAHRDGPGPLHGPFDAGGRGDGRRLGARCAPRAAPANAELYANALFGIQGTGGSTAMASSYDVMRRAGAAARAMLVAARRRGVGRARGRDRRRRGRPVARGVGPLLGASARWPRPPRGASPPRSRASRTRPSSC